MGDAFVYDKSDYHMGNGADTWEKASGPALFILRWMIERNFLDPEFWDGAADSLAKYRAGQMSLFELYEKECDLSLVNDQFSPDGNAFGQKYFDYESGLYLDDLGSVLPYGKTSFPEFSEDAYGRLRSTIDFRYATWQQGAGELTKSPGDSERTMLWKLMGILVLLAIVVGIGVIIYILNLKIQPP
jgi:hypothetical protein